MIEIDNSRECFVNLWTQTERCREELMERHRRFCPRRVLQLWYGPEATDDFIWEVCLRGQLEGLNEMPRIIENPVPARNFLTALVSVKLGIGITKVKVNELNAALFSLHPKLKSIIRIEQPP